MDQLHISALHPELSAIESKHIRAIVTLIWPYSSSTRQFALLLAEPDLGLRRKNGQVRARFLGASAKALATTGVGIGDEVVLSLRGAQFLQEGAVSTPGKSIDWELSYAQTVVVQVLRNGNEIANLELVDAAPTPALRSPARRETIAAPTLAPAYSSPAFLKRAHLSDGPFFQAPYDPFADEIGMEKGHDNKRRRKSYRDWKTYTFSARTPSPEKEDVASGDELDLPEASPSRAPQLPRTPVSPSNADMLSVAAQPLHLAAYDDVQLQAGTGRAAVAIDDESLETALAHDGSDAKSEQDENVRDADYYELYAAPDEFPSSDAQYAFGGDTEVDTEVNTEEEDGAVQGEPDEVSMSTTEADTDEQEGSQLQHAEEVGDVASSPSNDDVSTTSPLVNSSDAPRIAMPPPTLSALHTDVPSSDAGEMLTSIGMEPASPTLRPQDSATLPLPSPFPGEREALTTSYFGHAAAVQQSTEVDAEAEEELDLPSEASYIGETSFFSSIGSKASMFHPNHESAFTPVRFTFGMDGAGFSRPLELSSPEPEDHEDELQERERGISALSPPFEATASTAEQDVSTTLPQQVVPETIDEHVAETVTMASQSAVEEVQDEPEVIVFSSDSESEEEEEEESESGSDHLTREEQDVQPSYAEETEEDIDTMDDMQSMIGDIQVGQQIEDPNVDAPTITRHSADTSAIVDLGSPSEYSSDIEIQETEQQPAPSTRNSPFAEDYPIVSPSDHEDDQPDSHSEFINLDFVNEKSNIIETPKEQTVTHTPPQETVMAADRPKIEHPAPVESSIPLPPIEALDDYLQDAFPTDGFPEPLAWGEQMEGEERYPDIKLESMEKGSSFQVDASNMRVPPEDETMRHTSDELLIAVPEEGHKLGELQTISVPATAPAKNTRSKAKTSMSPTKEEIPIPKRTTRSTRSNPSVTPLAHTAVSPPRSRTRSTISASQDDTQTSPYSLRSQSQFLSPMKSTSATVSAATRRSPRKYAINRIVDSMPDAGASQREKLDTYLTSFEPAQGLNASQRSRFSDVAYVKDSDDEESARSEHSLSTVLHSDDWGAAGMQYTNHSDPVARVTSQDEDNMDVKPPPGTAPELRRRPSAKIGWKKTEPQVVIQSSSPARPNFSFITQPTANSPNRRLRSAGSTKAASPSPRIVRRTRKHVYDRSPEPEEVAEELSGKTTPKAGEGRQFRSHPISQPPAIDVDDELMRSSPPTEALDYPSINRESLLNSNRPITPNATQQPTMESQRSFTATRQGQSSLMTPQLTQTTSAGLRSFQVDDMEAPGVTSTTKPSPISKPTPRCNANSTDVASKSPSPTLVDPSSDVDSDTSPNTPSIGLSTPLAYYTPLKDLLYFLNRSSQFHSAANPDVLALITSSTSPAERAKKGAKHWGTTLHITDASSWPSTTTVQVFRAYQNALPEATVGDVILLRAFAVKSLNRQPTLVSADESSWCVWRWGKPLWGAKRGAWGEMRAREEMKGPVVERGEGEWREVEKLRGWYTGSVKEGVEGRSPDKGDVEVEAEGEV